MLNLDVVLALSSTVIHYLEEQITQPTQALAYYYFDFNEPQKLLFRSLIHSLTKQLLAQCIGIPLPLKELFDKSHSGTKEPNLEDLIGALKIMMTLFDHVYIVLDALDECNQLEEQDYLLKFLQAVVNWKETRIHLLVTSRQILQIQEAILPLITHYIDLQGWSGRVATDIKLYIDNMLKGVNFQHWSVEDKDMVATRLQQNANGMYVYLLLDYFY